MKSPTLPTVTVVVGAALAALAAPVFAEDPMIAPGTEKFKLNLGAILSQNDTSLRLEGPGGRGLEFGLEGGNGVQRDSWSTLASGTWRFKPNHRIGFQSFATRRENTRVTEQERVIDDQTIPAGSELKTTAKMSFLVANYHYSLLRDDRVELSAMAGIYGARFKFGFDTTTPPQNIESKTTAPLPMFGISLDTFITPRWTVSTFFEGFALKVQDVRGSISYIGLSTDYMLTRHFGLGMGIAAVQVSADVDKDNGAQHSFDWRSNNFFAYGQFRF